MKMKFRYLVNSAMLWTALALGSCADFLDRQKKILYSLENTPGLKTMSSVYSMDIPAGVTSYH